MAVIDNLEVKITSSAGEAVKSLNMLISRVERLGRAINKVNSMKVRVDVPAGLRTSAGSSPVRRLAGVTALPEKRSELMSTNTEGPAEAKKLEEVSDSVQKATGYYQQMHASMTKVVDVGNPLASVLLKIGQALGKIAIKAGKWLASKTWETITGPIKKAIEGIKTLFASIARIAFYRAIRSGIKMVTDAFKTGIENLYNWSAVVDQKFKRSMDTIATASLYVKNSLAAMVAPLINAIAPVLDALADKVVVLINLFNQLFAAMTGAGGYTKAKKHADEYADATSGAAKATKDFLMGFDELNVINESAGGSGKAGTNYSDMFENSPLSEFFEQIKALVADGRWSEIGDLLGEKVNEIIDKWDAQALGEKIGMYFEAGIELAGAFLRKVDFKAVGAKVAAVINGFFQKLDGRELGRTLAAKFNAAIRFASGFFGSLNWKEISRDLVDAINAWIDNADWEEVRNTLSSALTGCFTIIYDVVTKVDFAELISGVWSAIPWNTVVGPIGKIIGLELLKAILKEFSAVLTLLEPYLGPVADVLKFAIDDACGWCDRQVADTANGIKDSADSASGRITTDSNKAKTSVKGVTTETENLRKKLASGELGKASKTASEAMADAFSLVRNKLQEVWDFIKKIVDKLATLANFLTPGGVALNLYQWLLNGGGSSSSSKAYATGGFPEDGLFLANHNELVGRFSNGKTAVANNDQITQGIATAVYNAFTSAMSESSGGAYNVNVYLDGKQITSSVENRQRMQGMRIMTGGINYGY